MGLWSRWRRTCNGRRGELNLVRLRDQTAQYHEVVALTRTHQGLLELRDATQRLQPPCRLANQPGVEARRLRRRKPRLERSGVVASESRSELGRCLRLGLELFEQRLCLADGLRDETHLRALL